jgi:hypothetical protein
MKQEDPAYVKKCNISCLVVQIYCLLYELISLHYDGWRQYFRRVWNLVDFTIIFTYFAYFYIRFSNADVKGIPKLPKYRAYHDDNKNAWFIDMTRKYDDDLDGFINDEKKLFLRKYCALVHIFLIFTAFIKLMYFLRCNSKFGQFVQLVSQCVYDVRVFLFFFIAWVMLFG